MEKQKQLYDTFGDRYNNGNYDLVIGMYPGYKLYISAVIIDVDWSDKINI